MEQWRIRCAAAWKTKEFCAYLCAFVLNMVALGLILYLLIETKMDIAILLSTSPLLIVATLSTVIIAGSTIVWIRRWRQAAATKKTDPPVLTEAEEAV